MFIVLCIVYRLVCVVGIIGAVCLLVIVAIVVLSLYDQASPQAFSDDIEGDGILLYLHKAVGPVKIAPGSPSDIVF